MENEILFPAVRVLQCFAALTLACVLTAMLVLRDRLRFPSGGQGLPLAGYAIFEWLGLLAEVYLMEGTEFPFLDILRLFCYLAAYGSLLYFSFSVFLNTLFPRIVFTLLSVLLCLSAFLMTKHLSLLYPLLILSWPALCISAAAFFRLSNKSSTPGLKRAFFQLGLLQLLYLAALIPIVFRMENLFCEATLFRKSELVYRIVSAIVLFAFTEIIFQMRQQSPVRIRILRIFGFPLLLLISFAVIMTLFFSFAERKSILRTGRLLNAESAELEKTIQKNESFLTEISELAFWKIFLSTGHVFSLETRKLNASLSNLYQYTDLYPFLLNADGKCVLSGGPVAWVGLSFSKEPFWNQCKDNGSALIFQAYSAADGAGLFSARAQYNNDGTFLGMLVLKKGRTFFREKMKTCDFFAFSSPDRTVLLSSDEKLHGKHLESLTPDEFSVCKAKNPRGGWLDSRMYRTFAARSFQKPDELRNITIIAGADAAMPAVLVFSGLQVTMLVWFGILLFPLLLTTRKSFTAEKNNLELFKNATFRDSRTPAFLITGDLVIFDANPAVCAEFSELPAFFRGRELAEFFEPDLPLRDKVNRVLHSKAAEALPGIRTGIEEKNRSCTILLFPAARGFWLQDRELLFCALLPCPESFSRENRREGNAYHSLAKASGDLFFLLDSGGELSSELEAFFPGSRKDELLAMIENVRIAKRSFLMETERVTDGGSEFFEVLLYPVENETSGTLGIRIRNTTLLRNLENALREKRGPSAS